MSGAWGRLGALVTVGALALVVLGHLPRRAPKPAPAPPPAPLDTLTVAVRDGAVEPPESARPLHHRLALTRINRGTRPVRLALAGYEHRLAEAALAPGEARTDTFELDLPGEDFAWRVDGEPLGRLRVAGSHLVEGHR